MKRLIFRLVLGAVGCFAVLSATAAPYIVGEISFNGGATVNQPTLASSTAFTEFFGAGGPGTGKPTAPNNLLTPATGSYSTIPDGIAAASFSTFAFDGAPFSSFELWNFTVGSTVYRFEVTSLSVDLHNGPFLNLSGQGMAYITDFEPTPATWTMELTDYGIGVVTLGATVVVPEPSTAALFLVLGSALVAARRRLRA